MKCTYKRGISLALISMMVLGTNVSVYAAENEEFINKKNAAYGNTVVLSEYDMIMDLQNMTVKELSGMGYTDEEIEILKNFDMNAFVEDAQSKSVSELSSAGYTDEEIQIIQSDNTEAAARALLSEVTCRSSVDSITYDATEDETTVKTVFRWSWDDCPAMTFSDIIGVSVSNSMYLDESRSAVKVKYYENGDTSQTNRIITYDAEPVETTSYAECVFDMNLYNSSDPEEVPMVAMSGTATLYWHKNEEITEASTIGKYGHSILTCSPSVSVSGNGISFGFTPSIRVDESDEAYAYGEA